MPDKEMASQHEAVVQPFVQFWTKYVEEVNENSRRMMEAVNGNADFDVWRRCWLDALTQSLDAFLRSPAFLKGLKHNMDAVIMAKSQVNDSTQEVARNAGAPMINDISSLFERLQSIEETILRRLGTIEGKLQDIEQKINQGGQQS
jgi:hypothetical protein